MNSFWYVTKLVARHAADTLVHSRGMRLTNGNALAARLARTAFDMGIPIQLSSAVHGLLVDEGRVVGATLESPEGPQTIRARKGVVLACGGFPHDVDRRRSLFRHAPTGHEHWSPAPKGNTGDGIRLGLSAGAAAGAALPNAAAWVPVSRVPNRTGGHGVYPHFFDRGKPGVIAVTREGYRFANESGSYHDMMQALLAAHPGRPEDAKAFLVCDSVVIRRYGLGYVKPFPFPVRRHVRSGYLRTGRTLEALARAAGIDEANLRRTVERHNEDVAQGRDTAFGKGGTAYNRVMGDPLHGPNPCLAPIVQGPFYALELVFGDLGTFAGLATNGKAQVTDSHGSPIPGLYAVGNDMNSVMGGNYPGAGITLGPAMTFGFIAGRELALRYLVESAGDLIAGSFRVQDSNEYSTARNAGVGRCAQEFPCGCAAIECDAARRVRADCRA